MYSPKLRFRLEMLTQPSTDSHSPLVEPLSVVKLFNDLGPRFKSRPGGYTRILKMGFRVGDNAPMALVELVDRPAESEAPTGEPDKA